MPANSLKLIKDIDNYKFIYYWASPDSGQVSPSLPTLLHASEWIVEHQTNKYRKHERRKTTTDRRKQEIKTTSTEQELAFSRRIRPEGRRITDKLPEVDLDMTAEKFNTMKSKLMN